LTGCSLLLSPTLLGQDFPVSHPADRAVSAAAHDIYRRVMASHVGTVNSRY